MKVIHFLFAFCFLLSLSFPSIAQFGGGGLVPCWPLPCPPPPPPPPPSGGSGTSQGCGFNWGYTGFSTVNGSDFTGIGTAQTLTTLTQFQGGNINGWVNFVVDGAMSSTSATYDMIITLGGIPYKISYKAARRVGNPPWQFFQQGLLDISVNNLSIYSQQILNTQNRTVFRIAREGSVMRFYQDGDLIATPTVPTNTGAGAQLTVSTQGGGVAGRIHTTIFSPLCQELIPDFSVLAIDCSTGTGSLTTPSVQGGSAPYFHYFDNVGLDNIQTISTPTVGWVTTLDNEYRAATYYMGVGREIMWQHTTGASLSGSTLSSSTSNGVSFSTNRLSLSTDGWLGFRKSSISGWQVGFVDVNTPSSYLYEFRGNTTTSSDIYIGGSPVVTVQALLTDYLRISREGSQIKFYVNEVEVYSTAAASNELQAKFGFTQIGSTISYPTLSFCTPIDPPIITLASTDLSSCQYEDVPIIAPTIQNVTELRWYDSNPDGVSISPIYVGFSFNPDPNYPTPSLLAGTYTYYVTGIDLNGDETPSQTITLTVHEIPPITIRPIGHPLCPGGSESLDVVGAPPNSIYKWYKDNSLLNGEINANLIATQAGIYKVEITLPHGCVVVKNYDLRERVMPTLTLSYANGIGCQFTTLNATKSNQGPYTTCYVEIKNGNNIWSAVNVNGVGPDRNQFTFPAQIHIPGVGTNTYRVYYEDIPSGCRSYSNELAVTVYPLPQAIISGPAACQGDDMTLTLLGYNSSYTYQWQEYTGGTWINRSATSLTTLDVPYTQGSTFASFRVIVTNTQTNCTNTSTTYTINYQPSPTITYTSFVEGQVGETVNFGVVPPQNINYTYQWTGPNGYTSLAMNPNILVHANSYGEYTLVVSNGSCSTIYRAILAEEGIYATLKENLDASYYHTNREGKLYFKFDEKYGVGATGLAFVSVFNYDFQEVGQISLGKTYGYNWYELDLSSFDCIEGDYYVLHIKDELERRYVLRVKYATGNNKISIGEDFTTCISQSDQLLTVRLDAMSYVDTSPYSIYWYVSTDYTKINNLEGLSSTERDALLFKEEPNIDQQSSTILFSTQQNYINQNVMYAPSEGTYYVRAKIKNYCNDKETYSDQVVIITLNLDPSCRIASNERVVEKKHRFEFFFSIRRLLSPKPTTNPTTR